MTGKYEGSQPAITALTAIFSMLAWRQSGGMTPSTRFGSSRAAAIIARTRPGVGATMGSPSHQSRLTNSAYTSSSGNCSSRTTDSDTATSRHRIRGPRGAPSLRQCTAPEPREGTPELDVLRVDRGGALEVTLGLLL